MLVSGFQRSLVYLGERMSLGVGVCVCALLGAAAPRAIQRYAMIAVAIKVTSRGPVFFGHIRYGRDGKPFRALKFRTMVTNADKVLADYLHQHPECRLEWQRDHKLKNDPRVTIPGKWLRRFSLDELPQLLNVLAGQMSLVGPRPIVTAVLSARSPASASCQMRASTTPSVGN